MDTTNPYKPPSADAATGTAPSISSGANDEGVSPHLKSAMGVALFIQVPLGLLTLLVLDMGQMHRAFDVAFLCQWMAVFIIVLRRARTPTSVDLVIVRFGIIPIFIIATTAQYFRTVYAITHP